MAREIKSLKHNDPNRLGYVHREHRSKRGRIKRGVGKDSHQASKQKKKELEKIRLKEMKEEAKGLV